MQQHPGHYNDLLISLSIAIAALSCFVVVDLTDRLVRKSKSRLFLLVLSTVFGFGLWTMHFLGLLAMETDTVVTYDLPLLLFSLFISILVSYLVFMLLNNPRTRSSVYLGLSGFLFSAGMLLMHYCGVMAIQTSLHYEQNILSMLWSVLFSLIAALLAASYRPTWIQKKYNMFSLKKMLLVLLLTGSVTGTHYTAMFGAAFMTPSEVHASSSAAMLDSSSLGMILGTTFVLIAALVLWLLYRDRQKVMASARFNEQRYMALFEFSPDIVICMDPACKRLLSANPAMYTTTGYEWRELESQWENKLFSSEERVRFGSILEQAAAGRPGKLEMAIQTKQGGRLRFSSTVFPLITGDRQLVYMICKDITDLMRYQQELRKAKEEAESAARIKSEFLATVSHELRTPLNGIIGINQLLIDSMDNTEHLELLQVQSKSGQALLHVLNDILDLSVLEAGAMRLRQNPFQVSRLVQECMDLFEVTARDKGLQLILILESDIPDLVEGDSVRTRQVLLNIIGNAIKFTDKGNVIVTVDTSNTENGEGGRQYLQFKIKDTGIGIDPDMLELLFQPFSQVDGSYNRNYPGTGLGLAICKKLVDLMEGDIWVESTSSGGAEFTFRIALKEFGGYSLPG
ncbi:PAS domain S-box protein [Paenibacillus albidus]|uniref:ATP-binding protein n=1 Tax=Paenibacillus albidus TaxID=2041023 RepID=UPI001BEB3E06|nr:ATP-binding protein [Paenibacillus albidus]MBT2287851.1 PAS domain S-box protein [Paenibacillus albidus]